MTWALGTAVRLATQVYADGALVTPATVSLSIRLPDGTIAGPFTGADLISGGVGVYRYDYATVQAGRHVARWITTAPSGVDEEPFDVAPMWGEAGIVSLGAAKRQLKVSPADTSNDDEISTFIRATTEIVQRHAGSVLPLPVTARLRGGWRDLLLDHRPVVSVASVTLPGGQVLDPTGYELDAEAGVLTRMVGDYESCWEPGRITVNYTAGRAVVPDTITQAARIIIQHLWETQRGRMGSVRAGGSEEVWDPRWGYSIPRRALELLGDHPMGIA